MRKTKVFTQEVLILMHILLYFNVFLKRIIFVLESNLADCLSWNSKTLGFNQKSRIIFHLDQPHIDACMSLLFHLSMG